MILLCGQKAGVLALDFFRPKIAVCYDLLTRKHAEKLGVLQYKNLVYDNLTASQDLLLSVHGREMVREPFLSNISCFNIHPYLYCYKGADPVGRAIENDNTHASVGLHRMTERVDRGLIIFQAFGDIKMGNHEKIYKQLYPLYTECFKAFKRIAGIGENDE